MQKLCWQVQVRSYGVIFEGKTILRATTRLHFCKKKKKIKSAMQKMVLQGMIDRIIETGRCYGMEMWIKLS
jgi:hypothetical protein